jgi:hypothetical protein
MLVPVVPLFAAAAERVFISSSFFYVLNDVRLSALTRRCMNVQIADASSSSPAPQSTSPQSEGLKPMRSFGQTESGGAGREARELKDACGTLDGDGWQAIAWNANVLDDSSDELFLDVCVVGAVLAEKRRRWGHEARWICCVGQALQWWPRSRKR